MKDTSCDPSAPSHVCFTRRHSAAASLLFFSASRPQDVSTGRTTRAQHRRVQSVDQRYISVDVHLATGEWLPTGLRARVCAWPFVCVARVMRRNNRRILHILVVTIHSGPLLRTTISDALCRVCACARPLLLYVRARRAGSCLRPLLLPSLLAHMMMRNNTATKTYSTLC